MHNQYEKSHAKSIAEMQGAALSGADAARRDRSPIEEGVDRLHGNAEQLHSIVSHLEDRLSMVLRPSNPEKEVGATATASACPLSGQIDQANSSFAIASERLQRILGRLAT